MATVMMMVTFEAMRAANMFNATTEAAAQTQTSENANDNEPPALCPVFLVFILIAICGSSKWTACESVGVIVALAILVTMHSVVFFRVMSGPFSSLAVVCVVHRDVTVVMSNDFVLHTVLQIVIKAVLGLMLKLFKLIEIFLLLCNLLGEHKKTIVDQEFHLLGLMV